MWSKYLSGLLIAQAVLAVAVPSVTISSAPPAQTTGSTITITTFITTCSASSTGVLAGVVTTSSAAPAPPAPIVPVASGTGSLATGTAGATGTASAAPVVPEAGGSKPSSTGVLAAIENSSATTNSGAAPAAPAAATTTGGPAPQASAVVDPKIWLALGPNVFANVVSEKYGVAGKKEGEAKPLLVANWGLVKERTTVVTWNVDFKIGTVGYAGTCTASMATGTDNQVDDRIFVIQAADPVADVFPIKQNGNMRFSCDNIVKLA